MHGSVSPLRIFDLAGARVFIAGHSGLVGAALVRRLARERCHILQVPRQQLDLVDPIAVDRWMRSARPDAVVVAAGKVGGILANAAEPVAFLYDNLMIGANLIAAAHRHGVRRLLYLGSSCIYPKLAPQPLREEYLLGGPLEPTNEPYAIAKIAGIKLVQAYRHQYGASFISVLPTNLYGPGDNFDPASSHVLAALVRKVIEAREAGSNAVSIWGTGTPRREFLHVDDLADALVFLLKHYDGDVPINIGAGHDIAIADLAALVAHVAGYEGRIVTDLTKPDGTPRKLLDIARLSGLGWQCAIPLEQGIRETCAWYESVRNAHRVG